MISPLLDLLALSSGLFFFIPRLCVYIQGNDNGIYKARYLRFSELPVRALELSARISAAFFLLLFFTLAFV